MEEYTREYEAFEELGKGAYATVYRVVHRNTAEPYACKVMSKERLGTAGINQVKGEAAILERLDHPNIIRLHQVLEDEQHLILVTQLVTGGEVLKRLTQLHHYSERTAAQLMKNFVKILKYVHAEGIVHRDLKPENLLLRTNARDSKDDSCDSEVMLADFGFAAKYEGIPMTKACGTPYYIAPELLQTGVYNTRKGYTPPPCDMWSAGVMGYVLLCGYPPFRVARDCKDAKSKLFKQIVAGKVHFDRGTSWDAISDAAKDFLHKLLIVDPNRRMTAEQAEEHPWFAEQGVRNTHDTHLQDSLSEMAALGKQPPKATTFGAEAAFKTQYTESCEKHGAKPNSSIVDQLDGATQPLHSLDLANTYLGPKGFAVLVEIVNKHPTLRKLNMSNCLVNTEGVTRLCKVLRDPRAVCHIDTIDLSDNPLTSASGRALLYLAQTKTEITTLKLKRTHISQPLLKKIADQTERNKNASGKVLPAVQK